MTAFFAGVGVSFVLCNVSWYLFVADYVKSRKFNATISRRVEAYQAFAQSYRGCVLTEDREPTFDEMVGMVKWVER